MKQFSVTEYAKLEGISRQAVLKRIKSGTVKAKKIGKNYIITLKAMKNLILILAIVFCSCKKHHEDPISKSAVLHIEYSANQPTFSGTGFESKVVIYFPDKAPVEFYSDFSKANTISTDISLIGNQQITVNGFVIDSTGCGSSQSNVPVKMTLTYNGSVISNLSSPGRCIGSIQYSGTLAFIN
jgi:hypothetical protein